MSSRNIFAEDWQACLHAHYVHVLHEKDMSNEASLRLVLKQVGFDDPTLDGLRSGILADAPLTDLPAEEAPISYQPSAVPDITAAIGLEVTDPVAVDEAAPAEEMVVEEAPAEEPAAPLEPLPDVDVKPTQLSLF